MPNRMLKESICYSDDIDQLSAFEETVFYRLIVNVDDNGRFDGRMPFLKSRLFATKQGVTISSLETAFSKLVTVGLVKFYEVDGKPFLMLPNWNKHQKLQYVKSVYPAPVENNDFNNDDKNSKKLLKNNKNSKKLLKNNKNSKELSLEVEVEVEVEDEVTSTLLIDKEFDVFWSKYPRKVGKGKCRDIWKKIKPSKALFKKIMQSLEAQVNSKQWTKDNGQFIPHPSTWLNQSRWEDEPDNAGADQNTQHSVNKDYSTSEDSIARAKRIKAERAKVNGSTQ